MADGATEANGASGSGERAAILAEIAAGPETDAPVEAAAEVETAAQDEAVDEVEAAADEDAEVEADADESEQADTDEEVETDADPKVAKGLDQVRRAEKHARAKLEADRSALEQERQSHTERLQKLEQFESLAKRAKYDPTAVLRALGLNEDDFEMVGHAIYAESKAAAADPNRKAAAQARLREREKEDKLSATEKRIADLEAKIQADKAERAAAAEAMKYMSEIDTAAATKYPLVQHMLKVDGGETADALVATYNRLQQTLKRAPKAAEVVAAFDKRERARLTKLGIDPATIVKTPARVAAKPGAKPVVASKPAANTNGVKKEPSRDEIVAELAALKESNLS